MCPANGSPVAAALVVVTGNLLVICVEGFVVSIQATRLVLFKFFMHFFKGEGRGFQPAERPPGCRGQGG